MRSRRIRRQGISCCSYTGGGAVYRLGQYETAEIARAVLNDLYMHIPTGCIYQMPNDQRALVLARGMSDERPEKFAGNGKKPGA